MNIKLLITNVLVLVAFLASAQNQPQKPQTKAQMNVQKLGTVLYLIENFYVDTANIDKVTEDAIIAALKELDPHRSEEHTSELQSR